MLIIFTLVVAKESASGPIWCYNPCNSGLRRVEPNSAQITGLLQAWACGDSEALEALMPLVQGELQQIAHRQIRRERVGHTLQTTALVNEVFCAGPPN